MEPQNISELVRKRVRTYYWEANDNCATTTLKILGERYSIPLTSQLLHAAIGMHGAGFYGAQCGLVEGALMFIGIKGKTEELPETHIVSLC